MEKLEQYRQQIEEIDKQIIDLLTHRMDLSKAIGELKKEIGIPVYDPQREEELKNKNLSLVDERYRSAYLSIFESILKASKDLQL